MDRVKIKNGWLDFLVRQEYTHAVTFKPNDAHWSRSLDALHRLFVKVHMLVDRRIIGSRFARPNRADRRSAAVCIVEGLPFSGHLHGAFKIAPANWSRFEELFRDGTTGANRRGIWRTLMKSGTCVVEPIYEASGWHDYDFKNVWQTTDSDRVLLLPLRAGSPPPSI